jgi:hypothetical protein
MIRPPLEQGSHEQWMEDSGHYARPFELRAAGNR